MEIEQAIVVEVSKGNPHAVARIQHSALGRLVLEMVTFVDEKALLAKIVYHVKVQFAIAVDVGELCRVAPAAVVHTPPVSFLLESTVALVDEQKGGCSICRAEPRGLHDLPVIVVAGHVHVGHAIAAHVPNTAPKT